MVGRFWGHLKDGDIVGLSYRTPVNSCYRIKCPPGKGKHSLASVLHLSTRVLALISPAYLFGVLCFVLERIRNFYKTLYCGNADALRNWENCSIAIIAWETERERKERDMFYIALYDCVSRLNELLIFHFVLSSEGLVNLLPLWFKYC